MIASISKKNKMTFIIIIGFIIITFSFWLFIVIKIISNEESTDLVIDNLNKILIEESKINTTKMTLNENKVNLNRIDELFIGPDGVVAFLEEVETLGSFTNVKLKLSSVDVEKQEKNILTLNLKATGSFSNIYHFILLIENLPYKIVISKAYLKKNKKEEGSGLWEGSFTFNLLSFNNN